MKNLTDELELKFLDYLDKQMSDEEEKKFLGELADAGIYGEDIKELELFFENISSFPVPDPSDQMDAEFYSELEATAVSEKKSQINLFIVRLKEKLFPSKLPGFAYGLSFLVIGWLIGTTFSPLGSNGEQLKIMTEDLRDMKQIVMLTMLEKPSATERIKAVGLSGDFNNIDSKVVAALLNTLNNDPNVNVRLATVEALMDYADAAGVRAGLVNSITNQSSPLVQLALAEAMETLREKTSVNKLHELLERKDLNHSVRKRIEKSIKILI